MPKQKVAVLLIMKRVKILGLGRSKKAIIMAIHDDNLA